MSLELIVNALTSTPMTSNNTDKILYTKILLAEQIRKLKLPNREPDPATCNTLFYNSSSRPGSQQQPSIDRAACNW